MQANWIFEFHTNEKGKKENEGRKMRKGGGEWSQQSGTARGTMKRREEDGKGRKRMSPLNLLNSKWGEGT